MKLYESGAELDAVRQILGNRELGVYFGQSGEDVVVSKVFKDKRNGFYVDVGCNNPFRYSNTFALHAGLGWTGLNIDADPEIIKTFRKARPKDICVNAAVSDTHEDVELTVFKGKAHNTIDPEMLERKKDLVIDRVIRMTTRPLREILSEHLDEGRVIDFLNVDVEGVDLKALQSNDWDKFPASLICVEDHDFRKSNGTPIRSYMESIGYSLYSHLIQSSFYIPAKALRKR